MEKLKFLQLDRIFSQQSNFLEAFPNVKTLFLRWNSILNTTALTQRLNLLGNVENLTLDHTPLDVNFLQSIGNLTSLRTLSLVNCSLDGTLPTRGWCYLNNLEVLDLNGNVLKGELVPCLGNLTSIYSLDISNNQFRGNVASSPLAYLTMLRLLSLSNNHFQVPSSFKPFLNHSNLQFLLCDRNNLVAELGVNPWPPKFQLKIFSLSHCGIENNGKLQLPDFLYYQYDLTYIDLSYINFGRISFPHWLLENNTELRVFFMIDSCIVGPFFLPTHPHSNLLAFDVSNNKIQHQIPTNICSVFPNLQELVVAGNNFKSTIPVCLGLMEILEWLDMGNNQLFGGIPEELAMSRSLFFLRLSRNNLSGGINPTLYCSDSLINLYLDGNNFNGELPHSCPGRTRRVTYMLDLSDNHLSGKLPKWLWNYTNLVMLNFSNNQFEGPLPMELCNAVNLYFLDLSQNLLSGTIPSCFFNLQLIHHVHLSKNDFSGPILHAFPSNPSLVTLDLSENNLTGKFPDWIDQLPSLSVLLLKANHFYGEIPIDLCKLFSLTILDLSHNKLSGSIPSCLGNLTLNPKSEKSDTKKVNMSMHIDPLSNRLTNSGWSDGVYHASMYVIFLENYMEEIIEFTTKGITLTYKGHILDSFSGIDLSCNQLMGTIPPDLGNLSEIHGLNLSHNNLTGFIPSTFSQLKQIESLDLSYNHLDGQIPPQLTELNFLAVFTVAHNNLSGPLPDMKGQFGTFNESSYEGNPLLCGHPLENNCGEDGSPETSDALSSEEEDGFMDVGVFYISFVVSYGVVLVTIFIVLYINPYWRQTWFYFVEESSMSCYSFILDCLQKKHVGLRVIHG